MVRKRASWLVLVAILVLAGGGYGTYRYVYLPDQEPEQALMTAEVARGDLIISVSGTGVLYPTEGRDLSFETESGDEVAGYVEEVLVAVGDRVKEGDVLARLEDDDLQFEVLKATMDLRSAELDLADVSEAATEAELADAEAALRSAQLALTTARLTYENAQKSSHDADVRDTHIAVQYHAEQTQEMEANGAGDDALAEAWTARQEAEAAFDQALQKAKMEDLEAWNQVDQAENSVFQAQERLASLESGPDEEAVLRAELKVDRAELALEAARDNLEAAELCAPFDGTVVDVAAIAGERVGSEAVITLADLDHPLVQFWVEESDIRGVAVGNRVEIEFEGLPDQVFNGEVTRIDPALVTVDGTLAVQAWASLELPSTRKVSEGGEAAPPQSVTLLGDMNADIEVISAEARDVVLAPVQALREIGDGGQYAVFVVGADSELVMRPVEVGLQDAVNAEIVSGLEAGEVISLGPSSASTGERASGEEEMPGPGQMMPGGGMFGSGGGPGGRP
jgi:multidrug efflux pump subunit AcrA (membrane-fusion protein)